MLTNLIRPTPMVKDPSRFNDGTGEPGRDSPLGLREHPDAIVLYVDSSHSLALDTNDGTNPMYPLATLQEAVDKTFLTAGSEIRVSGPVSEGVTIESTDPTYCWIRGINAQTWEPTWTSGAAATNCLTVRGEGWRVSGFTFTVPSAAAAIDLLEVPGSSYSAYKTQIDHCKFDGFWSGLYGVAFNGAPHRVWIDSCEFLEIQNGGNTSAAITVTSSTHTNPYECKITNNLFWENDNHIMNLGAIRGFNMSLFQGNTFGEGTLIPCLLKLDLRGGSRGENIVTQNIFGGDYSNTGGYYANAAAPGMWVGNIAEDVLEPEVGDNGFTIAVPAA